MEEERVYEAEKNVSDSADDRFTFTSLSYHLYEEDVALDALLDLCKKNQVDIRQIFVSSITEQYLNYVSSLAKEDKDYDDLCGFLVLAATLIQLKSDSLLPRAPSFDDEYEDDDYTDEELFFARAEEYAALRDAADKLRGYERLNRFEREPVFSEDDYKLVIKNFSLDKMIAAFMLMLEKAELEEKVAPEKMIPKERFSVADRMLAIVEALRANHTVSLNDVLELVKQQVAAVEQDAETGYITLTHKPDTDKFNSEEDAFTDADGYN